MPTALAPERIRGPRSLLRQIREVMAEGGDAQARLDRVVRIIAGSLEADVCSIYLGRANGELELFATEGLNAGAVHSMRLRPGEGLAGLIMRTGQPLALEDAPSHPAFSYRPETGEDPYHAMMGVPILRGGRAVGVLVVQNVEERTYTEDEIDDLQTIAMVLAELVAGGDLVGQDELRELDFAPQRPERIRGQRFAEGLALGRAVLHERPVAPERLLADDPQLEEARLHRAMRGLRAQIDDMMGGQHGLTGLPFEVLETYRMFAEDRGWARSLEEGVRSGLTAEAAVERVRSEHRARLSQAPAYLRERLHDFEDLADRLLRHLMGERPGVRALPEDSILIARNLGPAELLEYDRTHLRGLLLEEGSNASHAAIVARALEIPCVGRLAGLRDRVSEGDAVIVDGDEELAHIRPRSEILGAFASRLEVRRQLRAQLALLRDVKAVTQDGVQVAVLMNAGLIVDMDGLDATGADGIGLFRTEFQFMVAEEMPRLDAQTELYSRVLDRANGRPVTFRTLDLGGDKVLPYMEAEREENPALGWRAIRMGLDRPALLRTQVRALIRAANGRDLRIMFPLIANVEEFRAARRVVDRELAWAVRRGRPAPASLRIGAMVETPSLLWHLDALLPLVDFISVGANDLMQYLFAADRGNPRVADRYDMLSPPALRALKTIVDAAAENGTPVSLCGEQAGRPLDAFVLLALGFERLSMPPSGVGPIKRMVLSTDREAARRGVAKLLHSSAGSVRDEVETLARKLNVAV